MSDTDTDADTDTKLFRYHCRNDATRADSYLNAKSLSAAHKRNSQLLKIPASTSLRGNKSEHEETDGKRTTTDEQMLSQRTSAS